MKLALERRVSDGSDRPPSTCPSVHRVRRDCRSAVCGPTALPPSRADVIAAFSAFGRTSPAVAARFPPANLTRAHARRRASHARALERRPRPRLRASPPTRSRSPRLARRALREAPSRDPRRARRPRSLVRIKRVPSHANRRARGWRAVRERRATVRERPRRPRASPRDASRERPPRGARAAPRRLARRGARAEPRAPPRRVTTAGR